MGGVTLQTSYGGVLIQRFRFSLQYLGGIASPSFSVSTIKASKHHSSLFSSQFAISERSHLYTPYSSNYSPYLHKRDFKDPQETRRSVHILSYVSFVLQTSFISSANRSLIRKLKMGRFERLVKTSAWIELFKEKYHIPQKVSVRHCTTEGVEFDRKVGEVVIPMIAFIEGGMTVLMGRITRDYLRAHKLCPHQCAPNFFRVLGSIDDLDRHLRLGLTWYDVAHLYEGHIKTRAGFYLKSQSSVVKLISCLPKSNKGMKDDYLILSGP